VTSTLGSSRVGQRAADAMRAGVCFCFVICGCVVLCCCVGGARSFGDQKSARFAYKSPEPGLNLSGS